MREVIKITKCLSRISPDMYLHMTAQVIVASGCDAVRSNQALDLLDDRLMAAGLLTGVVEDTGGVALAGAAAGELS